MTRHPRCSICVGRFQGDRGQVGGMEVLPFGFLVFISATLLFANVWGVIDAKMAVTAAAREGVRAFVESDDGESAAQAAVERSTETLDAYGRGGERATVLTPRLDEPFGRCVRVTVTVRYDVATIAIPFIGGFGSLQTVESSFTELVDPFRDGVGGTASC